MKGRTYQAAAAVGALLPLAAATGAQKVAAIPVEATYWMSAETVTGMAGGNLNGVVHQLDLQLGSARKAAGTPAADHLPPAALRAGASLPLTTPVARQASPDLSPRTYDPARIKGKLLIYWGCGERAGPGQPLVIDMATMGAGKASAFGAMLTPKAMNPPSPARHATYGEWPNEKGRTTVPAAGSLVGEHVVRGNYSPELRFALTAANDFLGPLRPSSRSLASGAMEIEWAAVPRALGYAAAVVGSSGNDTMVMWSSSQVKMASGIPDYLDPGETARLVQQKALLAPATTQCAVPTEVVQAVKGRGSLQMAAYGPEANFGSPAGQTPRWTAKVRTKSTHMGILGMDLPSMNGDEAATERASTVTRPFKGSVRGKVLRGLGGLLGVPRPL